MSIAHLDVTWVPSEHLDPAKSEPTLLLLNRKMELFDPVRVMVAEAQKDEKKRLITDRGLSTCAIRLTRAPRAAAVVGSKVITADVRLDFEAFLGLPNDAEISGSFVVGVMREALPLFDAAGCVDVDLLARVVDVFEANGFRHHWIMKNAKLGKRDFRIKLEVSEYPGSESVWAEITSEHLDIAERFEVFHQEKFTSYDEPIGMWTKEYTQHGGLFSVKNVKLTADGIMFGSNQPHCFVTTMGRGQLSDALCDALGIG